MAKNKKKKTNLRPNLIAWFLYTIFSKVNMKLRNKIKINRQVFKKRNKKEGCVVIYNHATKYDHYLTTMAFNYTRVTYVVSSHFYYNKTLRLVLNMVNAIPKEQFKVDIAAIKNVKKALAQNLPVAIAPAGQMTMHGNPISIDPSIVKLLKLAAVDVYAIKMHGIYFAFPKWHKYSRKVPINIEFVKVLTKEELSTLSDEEIYNKVKESIDVNDHEEVEKYHYQLKAKSLVAGMERMLYECPKCHMKNTIYTDKNMIACSNCNQKLIMNSEGLFEKADDDVVYMKNEAEWYQYERNEYLELAKNKQINLQGSFYLYSNINDKKYSFAQVGKGIVVLKGEELYYEGTINGKMIHKDFKLSRLTQLPFEFGKHFDIPDEEAYFEFKPTEEQNVNIITEFVQAIEAISTVRKNEYDK